MWLTPPAPGRRQRPGRSVASVASLLAVAVLWAVAVRPGAPASAEPVPAPPAFASPPSGGPGPAATRIALLASGGFDPVSYFLEGGPRPGSSRFEASWGGRVWRFAGSANRAAFVADPEVYAPRLGGYDAAGVLDGRLADADPTLFAVVGERLYLFRDAGRRARFLADPGLARAAEAAWPGLRNLLDTPPD